MNNEEIKDKNNPQIRFNGFEREWEKKNYKEVFDTSVANNTLSRAELTSEPTSTRNIHYGDILIKYKSILDVKRDDFPFIPETVKIESQNLLKNGDIVFADTAEDETCGKAVEILNIDNENVVAGLHTFIARPKIQFEKKYLGYFINSPSYHEQLIPYMQGTKVTSVSKSNVQKTFVYYPEKKEQSKIGDFFSQIDDLIESAQKEYNKIVTLKKCMLQKMFPKNGQYLPEIRFKGFSTEWQEYKISDIFKVTRGYVLATTETGTLKTREKPYPVFSSQTMNNGLMGYYSDYLFEDAITWTTDGANAGTVRFRQGKFYCTNVCGVLLTDKLKPNQMIAEALNKVAKNYVSYVGNAKLMNNVMAGIKILLPQQEEERNSISEYFQTLDNLISKQSQELEILNNVKKTLLSKMFV